MDHVFRSQNGWVEKAGSAYLTAGLHTFKWVCKLLLRYTMVMHGLNLAGADPLAGA